MNLDIGTAALGRLRAAKATMHTIPEIAALVAAQDEVLARYSPMFQPGAIATISEEALRSFLYFENNKHWTGLNRQVNRICADMDATRRALVELVDEERPLESRMEAVVGIKGMGKGIITAILHVAYPDLYGVWNNTSDLSLDVLGLKPAFSRGSQFGDRYVAINAVLRDVAASLDVDLWTLDAIWWNLRTGDDDGVDAGGNAGDGPGAHQSPRGPAPMVRGQSFALERHLHDFLFDKWDDLPLTRQWELYTRPGEPDAGYEFSTPVGRIDLLARHRSEPRWLVIELKRRESSDQTVGQVMRYIGWIRAHHIEPGERVEGLIIASEGDAQLHYAISAIPELAFLAYEVDFALKPGPSFEEFAKP